MTYESDQAVIREIQDAWPKTKHTQPRRDNDALTCAVAMLALNGKPEAAKWLLDRAKTYLERAGGEMIPELRTWANGSMYEIDPDDWKPETSDTSDRLKRIDESITEAIERRRIELEELDRRAVPAPKWIPGKTLTKDTTP